jgi:hypothetical protein
MIITFFRPNNEGIIYIASQHIVSFQKIEEGTLITTVYGNYLVKDSVEQVLAAVKEAEKM